MEVLVQKELPHSLMAVWMRPPLPAHLGGQCRTAIHKAKSM
jgi:hypothetical protein